MIRNHLTWPTLYLKKYTNYDSGNYFDKAYSHLCSKLMSYDFDKYDLVNVIANIRNQSKCMKALFDIVEIKLHDDDLASPLILNGKTKPPMGELSLPVVRFPFQWLRTMDH